MHIQRNLQFSTGFAAVRFVAVGVFSADAVIDMGGGKLYAVVRAPVLEMEEQADRIRAAGKGGDHSSGVPHGGIQTEAGEGIVKFQGMVQKQSPSRFL
jgi:hypothetical protein